MSRGAAGAVHLQVRHRKNHNNKETKERKKKNEGTVASGSAASRNCLSDGATA